MANTPEFGLVDTNDAPRVVRFVFDESIETLDA
jgi:hypothetical protein